MDTNAIVLSEPGRLSVRRLPLTAPQAADVVVAVSHSAISAGTERLIWTGTMPDFPGMGFPLVPGYETVGVLLEAGADSGHAAGDSVFVPGASCFGDVRGLFGGAASHLVVPGRRAAPIDSGLGARGTLLALAATAHHALEVSGTPDLIVGHGAFGRLLCRLTVLRGASPTVWERNPARHDGAHGYKIVSPETDPRRDYGSVIDASGDSGVLDSLVQRLAPRGQITLAGFYAGRLSFAFPPAFMREASIRIAAEWDRGDLDAVLALVRDGALSLDDIITHAAAPADAESAYRTAFDDPRCLKMVLDWSLPQ